VTLLYLRHQDVDADTLMPDQWTEISQNTDDIGEMIKMNGLSPSTAARSCRDVKMENRNASDGMLT
jgi:hypothetical protein